MLLLGRQGAVASRYFLVYNMEYGEQFGIVQWWKKPGFKKACNIFTLLIQNLFEVSSSLIFQLGSSTTRYP